MERQLAEPGLLDGVAVDLGGPRTAAFFEKCNRHIPWKKLADSLRGLYDDHEKGGREPWPVILMVKCVMLQKWFGLSDPQLEEQLRDRLSFRRFVGLSLMDKTPDETTFVRFRQRLLARGHGRTIFDAVVKHLESCGLVLNNGTLVDATMVQAPKGRKRDDGSSTRDQEASFTKKHGRTYHGYKAHVATDKRAMIKDYRFTTASVHDSQKMDELIEGETKAVYGDSAYMDKEREERFNSRGIFYGIVRRRVRGQKELSATDQLANRLKSTVRAIVEHPFAWMKRQMKYDSARYRGLLRNAADFSWTAAACNLKRSFSLATASG
jgi:IS5 family transposase